MKRAQTNGSTQNKSFQQKNEALAKEAVSKLGVSSMENWSTETAVEILSILECAANIYGGINPNNELIPGLRHAADLIESGIRDRG